MEQSKLVVAGRGEAAEAERRRFESPELSAIRYADPAAWITATAVANAIAAAAITTADAVAVAHDRVGVIAISAEGPVEAMAAMCDASKSGSSSPIRFPASNAGSLAGLTSIALGFRGPTLMLTLPGDRGVPVGFLLAEAWLARQVAAFVVVSCCGRRDGRPVARTLLLARGDREISDGSATGAPLDPARDGAWLASPPELSGAAPR
jgi:hypothetical protein